MSFGEKSTDLALLSRAGCKVEVRGRGARYSDMPRFVAFWAVLRCTRRRQQGQGLTSTSSEEEAFTRHEGVSWSQNLKLLRDGRDEDTIYFIITTHYHVIHIGLKLQVNNKTQMPPSKAPQHESRNHRVSRTSSIFKSNVDFFSLVIGNPKATRSKFWSAFTYASTILAPRYVCSTLSKTKDSGGSTRTSLHSPANGDISFEDEGIFCLRLSIATSRSRWRA